MTIPLLVKSSKTRVLRAVEKSTVIVEPPTAIVGKVLVDLVQAQPTMGFEKPFPLGGGALPASVSHQQHQTQWPVSQGNRGTCWAFAGVSALEAAYHRKGTVVDLSQSYLFSMMKSWGNSNESPDGPVFGSSLVGFQGAADVIHHLAMLRVPERRDADYVDQDGLKKIIGTIPQITGGRLPENVAGGTPEQADWFEYDYAFIPLHARWRARYGVATYGTAPRTIDGIKRVVAAGYDAVVDVYDQSNKGGHVIVIYGYDDATQEFLIKNSQPQAPSSPFQRMKYDGSGQFRIDPGGVVFFVTDVRTPSRQLAAAWVGRWSMDHNGETGRLVIRAIADMLRGDLGMPDSGNQIRLGTYFAPDGRALSVSGWFSNGGRVLEAIIGFEHFRIALHADELDRASGRYRDWQDKNPGGVTLSRGIATGGTSAPPVMRGVWDLDVGGTRMTLRVPAPTSLDDAVTGSNVKSTVFSDSPTRLQVSFRSAKNIDLHAVLDAHVGEPALLSGLANETASPVGVTAKLASSFYLIRPDGVLDWARHLGRTR